MSEKIVKITNGKILNYKISAPNYKTIYGSKLITADSTISHNMIAEDDPNGVYSLGDRIGNIASFVGYFNAQDPNTTAKTYAVFVLDAKYRSEQGLHIGNAAAPYYSSKEAAEAATETATCNCNNILANSDSEGVNFARSIILPSFNIAAQVPNFYEFMQIVNNRSQIDDADPTISSYPSRSMSSLWANNSFWSSNFASWDYAFGRNPYSGIDSFGTFNTMTIIPVFEIPVE